MFVGRACWKKKWPSTRFCMSSTRSFNTLSDLRLHTWNKLFTLQQTFYQFSTRFLSPPKFVDKACWQSVLKINQKACWNLLKACWNLLKTCWNMNLPCWMHLLIKRVEKKRACWKKESVLKSVKSVLKSVKSVLKSDQSVLKSGKSVSDPHFHPDMPIKPVLARNGKRDFN